MTTRATTIVFTPSAAQRVSRWLVLAASSVLLGSVMAWALVHAVERERSDSGRTASMRSDSGRTASMRSDIVRTASMRSDITQRPPVIAAAPSPSPSPSPPALSTLVAPGVHITPLSVPPGTVPMPTGPSPDDSEPEN